MGRYLNSCLGHAAAPLARCLWCGPCGVFGDKKRGTERGHCRCHNRCRPTSVQPHCPRSGAGSARPSPVSLVYGGIISVYIHGSPGRASQVSILGLCRTSRLPTHGVAERTPDPPALVRRRQPIDGGLAQGPACSVRDISTGRCAATGLWRNAAQVRPLDGAAGRRHDWREWRQEHHMGSMVRLR